MSHYINETIDENTTNGESAEIDWLGGPGTFAGQGTWDGATMQLQFSIDGGTNWADVPGSELTLSSDDLEGFQVGPCQLRVKGSDITTGVTGTSVLVRVAPAIPGWILGTDL